jgi:hypothetical protein
VQQTVQDRFGEFDASRRQHIATTLQFESFLISFAGQKIQTPWLRALHGKRLLAVFAAKLRRLNGQKRSG